LLIIREYLIESCETLKDHYYTIIILGKAVSEDCCKKKPFENNIIIHLYVRMRDINFELSRVYKGKHFQQPCSSKQSNKKKACC
jgi:hypothetical protein